MPAEPVAKGGDALDRERQQTEAQIIDLAEEFDAIVASAAMDAPDDEHDAEGATVGYERARVASLLAHARQHLVALELAAQRRDAGSYQRCVRCGRPIGAERLAALPATAQCVTCAAAPGGSAP
jgi:DnaK suppressor protein